MAIDYRTVSYSCLVCSIRIHDIDLEVAIPLAIKRYFGAVWRPAWMPIETKSVGQSCLVCSIRVHNIDLEVAIPTAYKRNLAVNTGKGSGVSFWKTKHNNKY